jgi:hypothetical protein
MTNENNVLNFPNIMKNAVDEDQWKELQGEFYLDCYFAYNGKPADNPEELREWLKNADIYATIDSPFFIGWMIRKLSEEQ